MAEQEYRMLLSVDTGESVKSIGELKDNIKFLKKAVDETEVGTEEYTETLKELEVNQRALKLAMQGSAKSFKDLERDANGVGKSYNALSTRLTQLKKQHKAMTDEVKRAEISAEISNITDELKDLDAQNGVFSRNVGNYSNSIKEAYGAITTQVDVLDKGFGSMGLSIGGLKAPLMGLNGIFTMLSKNPFIAIVGVLVLTIQKVAKWIKTSEENSNALNRALAPLTASTTALKNMMQKLGEWLGKVAQWITDVAKKLHLFSDKMLESIEVEEELTAREQEQVRRRREFEKENAKTERDIAELKNKASQKDRYTARERLAFLDEAISKEEEIAKRRVEIAKEELAIQQGRSAQAGNSAEENDRLAEAEMNVYRAESDYLNKTKELNAQRVENINMIKAETRATEQLATAKKVEAGGGAPEEEVVEEADVLAEQEMYRQHLITDAEWQGMSDRLDIQKQEEDAVKAHYDEEKRLTAEAMEAQKQIRKDGLMTIASSTADILGSIAEFLDKNDEKQFKAMKGLQIAQATINTIAGAIGAYTLASATIPPPFGQIVGGVQATAVTLAGVAQIAKLAKMTMKGASSGGKVSGISAPTPANAPVVEEQPQMMARLTGAKEEERLNRMAQNQKVYILNSDLEAASMGRKAQVAETSF